MSVKTILITGGAGFIGSHVVRLFVNKYPEYRIVNLDKLTYAGNPDNLADIQTCDRYVFVHGDICDRNFVRELFTRFDFSGVIHLAAESHVDRSVLDPLEFVQTNILGTLSLLDAATGHWSGNTAGKVFYHISTDEVYGSLGAEGLFTESTAYDPQSPYSASKAASDHFVRAYGNTFGLPFLLSNCSNNYGPNQYPEKLIPLMISNILAEKELPVYGKGENVRDWLYVEDHARAIDLIFHRGVPGETYLIGGANEWRNIDLVDLLCRLMDKQLGRPAGASRALVRFVQDRPGHDRRYAIDPGKLQRELGWKPSLTFEAGIQRTVEWYIGNQGWLENIRQRSQATAQ